jgi:predicted nucleic acid-binding protein
VTELADTSALILARRDPSVGRWLRDAIVANAIVLCDQVVLEFLRGARNAAEFAAFEKTLSAFRWLRIEPVDWDRARAVFRALSGVTGGYHRSVPIADALIAAVAERHGVRLAHFDRDYDRIAEITGQAVRWVAPPPSKAAD